MNSTFVAIALLRPTQHDKRLLLRVGRGLLRRVALNIDAVSHIHQPSDRTQVSEPPRPSEEARALPRLDRRLVGVSPPEALPALRDLSLYLRCRPRAEALAGGLQLRRKLAARRGDNGLAERGERPHCSFGRHRGGWKGEGGQGG